MKLKVIDYPKPEIYIPIDSSNLKSIIPTDDEIIYSALCRADYRYVKGGTEFSVSWQTHILLTTGGLAYTEMNYDKSKEDRYIPWHKLYVNNTGLNVNRASWMIRNSRDDHTTMLMITANPDNPETIEELATRLNKFHTTYRPFLIELKKEWIKVNKDNPDIKKKEKKRVEKTLELMEKELKKDLHKDQKRKENQQKKAQKSKK